MDERPSGQTIGVAVSALLIIAIGGGIGAGLRWLLVLLIPSPRSGFPVAITVVNVAGSFILGLVVGADIGATAPVDIDAGTIGVLGGFTTFSTWLVDVDRAGPDQSTAIAAVPLALGFMAAMFGLLLGAALA